MSQPSEGAASGGTGGAPPAKFRPLGHGSSGRLGKVIVEVAKFQPDLAIKGATRQDPVDKLVGLDDVVIDVTAPAGTNAGGRLFSENQKPLVVGNTGHHQEQIEALSSVSQRCPVLLAPN